MSGSSMHRAKHIFLFSFAGLGEPRFSCAVTHDDCSPPSLPNQCSVRDEGGGDSARVLWMRIPLPGHGVPYVSSSSSLGCTSTVLRKEEEMEDLLTLGKDGGEAKRKLVSGFAFLFLFFLFLRTLFLARLTFHALLDDTLFFCFFYK